MRNASRKAGEKEWRDWDEVKERKRKSRATPCAREDGGISGIDFVGILGTMGVRVLLMTSINKLPGILVFVVESDSFLFFFFCFVTQSFLSCSPIVVVCVVCMSVCCLRMDQDG